MADDKVATPVEASPAVEDTPAPATEVSKEENPAAAAPESQAEETAEAVAPAADKEALEETAEGSSIICSCIATIASRGHWLTNFFVSLQLQPRSIQRTSLQRMPTPK